MLNILKRFAYTMSVYGGPCILRPLLQPIKYGLKFGGGLKMEGYLYWKYKIGVTDKRS